MTITARQNKDFTVFALEFAQKHQSYLQKWSEHNDPMRRAVAQIIIEAGGFPNDH